MRVLEVFEPPEGGVPEHVLELTAGLLERGHVVDVAGPAQASVRERLLERTAYRRLPFVRSYRTPHRDVATLAELHALLRGGRYDLVHAHSAKAGALARIAARAAGLPCVYSPHCYPFVGPVSPLRQAVAARVERRLGRMTAQTICCCRAERANALAHRIAPAERLSVIHYGVPACPGVAPSPELVAFADGAPLVGAVCALRPQKGLDALLDAAPTILAQAPETRIAIVGNGPSEPLLRRRAERLGLDDRVGFFAFAPPSATYLSALDVFVLPSRWEGLPIAVLEALACGVPTVATDVEGTAEGLRGVGRLVPRDDPPALAQAVLDLLADERSRDVLAGAARQRAAERFAVGRMIDETVAVYERARA